MPDGAGLAGDTDWRVVLVSMPFMDPYRPSIQLGLLKSLVASHGFPVRALHAYLQFAAAIGMDDYQLLAHHRGPMVGEWLFSLDAFGDAAPDRESERLEELSTGLSYLAASAADLPSRFAKIRQIDI